MTNNDSSSYASGVENYEVEYFLPPPSDGREKREEGFVKEVSSSVPMAHEFQTSTPYGAVSEIKLLVDIPAEPVAKENSNPSPV